MDLTRNTPSALLTALSGPFFYPVVLVDLDWPGRGCAPIAMRAISASAGRPSPASGPSARSAHRPRG
ncbi:hypothetical protein QWZ10_06960 [Paracoccus cavernae]|uniref:Uncharacterized protein n=1 Tax=Paracoccus cavernae TaxID=1571207 RepID=A0ABT8D4B0_9RHOB|nr:hypothetical protein [Paracoccus cavernae]